MVNISLLFCHLRPGEELFVSIGYFVCNECIEVLIDPSYIKYQVAVANHLLSGAILTLLGSNTFACKLLLHNFPKTNIERRH